MTTKERDPYIDFLRCLGLLLIILAHVHAPEPLHQFRCFDVPLMVFVSGLSYANKKVKSSWSKFYWPRIKRLVIPIYIFLIVDIVAFALIKQPFPLEVILKSFLLCIGGAIGYVWVIKVFLLIMLVTPVLLSIHQRYKYFSLGYVFAAMGLQMQLVRLIPLIPIELLKISFVETLPYLIGYSIFFSLGLCLRDASVKKILLILVSAVMLLGVGYWRCYSNGYSTLITPYYKYPPQTMFILYGLVMTTLMWTVRPIISRWTEAKWVSFIGRNTIWIYVWHILFVSIANLFIENWGVKYLLVLVFSVGTYLVQYRLVSKYSNTQNQHWITYFAG